MSKYSLEDLYQCSLEEFAEKMGTTVEELIERKRKKIDILQEAYDKVIEKRDRMDMALLAKAIMEKIHIERKSIARYERWLKKC